MREGGRRRLARDACGAGRVDPWGFEEREGDARLQGGEFIRDGKPPGHGRGDLKEVEHGYKECLGWDTA